MGEIKNATIVLNCNVSVKFVARLYAPGGIKKRMIIVEKLIFLCNSLKLIFFLLSLIFTIIFQ